MGLFFRPRLRATGLDARTRVSHDTTTCDDNWPYIATISDPRTTRTVSFAYDQSQSGTTDHPDYPRRLQHVDTAGPQDTARYDDDIDAPRRSDTTPCNCC